MLLWVAAVAVGASAAGGYVVVSSKSPPVRTEVLRVAVGPEADGAPVTLDATLYLPDSKKPAPAVVLAHGFGGSKQDEDSDARYLAQHGYVAIAYSARLHMWGTIPFLLLFFFGFGYMGLMSLLQTASGKRLSALWRPLKT